MPSPSNVILGGTNEPTLGTTVPAQNAAASLFGQQVARGPAKCDKNAEPYGESLVWHTEEGRLNTLWQSCGDGVYRLDPKL